MPIQMVCDSTPSLVSAALRETLQAAATTNGRVSGISGTSYGSGGASGTLNGTITAGSGLSSQSPKQHGLRRGACVLDDNEYGEDETDELVESISQSLRPGGQQMKPVTYEEGQNYSTSLDQLKSKYIVLHTTTNSSTTGDGPKRSSYGSTNASVTTNGTGASVHPSKMPTGPSSSSSSASSAITMNDTTKFSSTTPQPMHGGKLTSATNLHNGVPTATASPASAASGKETATLPTPKRTLFPREDVRVGWKATGRKWHVGAGMINMGNTCYLNSTLQALFHVPAIANWLVEDVQHRERCDDGGSGGSCIICAMAKTLLESQSNQSAIRPYLVYSKLRLVCKHLVPGRQEDAHEFLRYLVEAMEKSYLGRYKNSKELDQYSKETTPLNQILGGYLRSEVKCPACYHVSTTFQHFEDLLLDIRKANSIDEALINYFARERLEENGYKCESCKRRVAATKQFSLERAPFALCVQLKRFSMLGGKINKPVELRSKLDLTPFSSPALKEKSNGKLLYKLTSMVTHLGSTQHCGHYTAIGHTEAGGYHVFDDSSVRSIGMHSLTTTNAYILFYELESPVGAAGLANGVCRTKPTATVGGHQPSSTATLTSMGHLGGSDGAAVGASSGTQGKASSASPLRVLGSGGGNGPAGGFFPSKLEQKSSFIGPMLPNANGNGSTAVAAGQGTSSGVGSRGNEASGSSKHAIDTFSSPSSTTSTLSNASPLTSPVKQLHSSQSTTLPSVSSSTQHQTGGGHQHQKVPKLQVGINSTGVPTSSGCGAMQKSNGQKEDRKSSVASLPQLPSMPKLAPSSTSASNKSTSANSSAVVSLVPYETDDDSSSDEDDAENVKRTPTSSVTNGATKRSPKQAASVHYSNGSLKPIKLIVRGKVEQQQHAMMKAAHVDSDDEEARAGASDDDERQELDASRSPQMIKTKRGIWKVSNSSTTDQLSLPDSSSSGGSAPSSKGSSPATSGGTSPSSSPGGQQSQLQQRNGGGDASTSVPTNGHRTNAPPQQHQQQLNGGDKRKPITMNGYHHHHQQSANQSNGGGPAKTRALSIAGDAEPTTGEAGPSSNGIGAVQMLLKMSHRGYGAPVKSWDGQETTMDRELSSEKREERKRQIEDDRETEMDRGRVKKTKVNGGGGSSVNDSFGNGTNLFQQYQNGGGRRGKWNGNRNGNHFNHHHHHHQQQNNFRGNGSYYSNGHGQRHHGGGGSSGFRNNGRHFGGRNGSGGNFHTKAYHHHQRTEASGGGGGLANGGSNNSNNGYH